MKPLTSVKVFFHSKHLLTRQAHIPCEFTLNQVVQFNGISKSGIDNRV